MDESQMSPKWNLDVTNNATVTVNFTKHENFNFTFSEWDGMIKELLEQRADLAIADLTITYDREQVSHKITQIDFLEKLPV